MDYTKSNISRILFVGIGLLLGVALVGGVFMLTDVTEKNQQSNQGSQKPPASKSPAPQITKTQTGLENPASVYCKEQGGQTIIQTRGDGGQYGLCDFGSGMSCEEWAMMRGECPTGGVRTTGFDTIEQKYCAWSGGTTLAEPNATCTFTNGKTCSVDAYYTGTCTNN